MIEEHGGQGLKESYNPDLNTEGMRRIKIESRYLNDCEMIGIGAFSPLEGFMNKAETVAVLENMKLPNGTLWPIPIVLPVSETLAEEIKEEKELILCSEEGREVALLKVSEIFTLDKKNYVNSVYGTDDEKHPGVEAFMNSGDSFLAGKITLIQYAHSTEISEEYFLSPKETRARFREKGWKTIVAFQTRNPIHRAHEYIQKSALEFVDGLLIHPIVGETKSDDIPAPVRMKCYEVLIENYYSKNNTLLSVMPAAMRYAGPKEAILHALVRQNYGCTHFIIGRDHAGVGDYYGTYDAQELLLSMGDKLKITPLPFEHAFYCKECEAVTSKKTCPHDSSHWIHLSGTQVRTMLKEGQRPPVEFTREKVADVLLDWAQNKN
jgi:sulfate adenylyltransferase